MSGEESRQSPWPTPVRSCLQVYKTNADVELTPSLSIRLKTSSTWYTNSESWTACPSPGPRTNDAKEKHAGLSQGILHFFLPCKTLIRSPTMHFKKVIHITAVKLHISYLPAKESLHIISITGSGVKHHSWNRGIRGIIGAVLQKFQNARGWRCIKWFVQNRVIEVS